MPFPRRVLLLTMFVWLLSACVAKEVLISKSPLVPAGVDLSGQWQIQDDGRDVPGALRSPNVRESAVRVFLELGQNLKITQTEFGVFVSFDRSIVEEYRFGENRAVSVGPISASRVSGWEGERYVIETLDEEGDKLIEHYRLSEDGSALLRQIVLIADREVGLDTTQRFARR